MRITTTVALVFSLLTAAAGHASAQSVTIMLNGYPNFGGGRVSGPGLQPVPIPEGADKVVVTGIAKSQTYRVSLGGGNSFDFSVTENGNGVAYVTPVNSEYEVVKEFRSGSNSLVLNSRRITLNANSGQTGGYYAPGLIRVHSLKPNSGPLDVMAVPGTYRIDNFQAGNEDYSFVVDDRGLVGPGDEAAEEFAEFDGNSVLPRSAIVRFEIQANGIMGQIIPSYPEVSKNYDNETFKYVFDVRMVIGSAGVNVAPFGKNMIEDSNAVKPDGTPYKGHESKNDLLFFPRLRYDAEKGFYFVTVGGTSRSVYAEASGVYDGTENQVKARITATIIEPAQGTK